MKRAWWIILIWPLTAVVAAQPNCELYPSGSSCRQACQYSERADQFPQGSRASQMLLDSAIALCPTLPYAWAEKSVPYLKRGDFIMWRQLLDRAVDLAPRDYLGYRAGCLFDCLRDYKQALTDLQRLETITKIDFIGYNANGDYDLRIVKALCLRELGRPQDALQTFKHCLADNEKKDRVGLYDYYHYGASLYRMHRYTDAMNVFQQQAKKYQKFAETYYFMALIYEHRHNRIKAKSNFIRAYEFYTNSGYHRADPYCVLPDQVFLTDINRKLRLYRR